MAFESFKFRQKALNAKSQTGCPIEAIMEREFDPVTRSQREFQSQPGSLWRGTATAGRERGDASSSASN
jgi:hypothetical protein